MLNKSIFIFIFLLLQLFKLNEAYAQTCVGSRNILIVDRTSQLNSFEARALEDGVSIIFGYADFSGELMVGEVRGSSLSFEWLYESCVTKNYVPSNKCRSIQQGSETQTTFTEDPYGWMMTFLYGSPHQQLDRQSRAICAQERIEFANRRKEDKARVLGEIGKITEKPVTPSQTALADTIFRIVQARCMKFNCNLYIFSNLLDIGWKDLTISNFDLSEAGRRAVIDASRLKLSSVQVGRVMVWGFGFDEQDGERKGQLSDQDSLKLEQYWTGFFEEISSNDVYIGFEMPQ